MKQKKLLLGALVLGMSVLAVACGNPSSSQPAQSADTTVESPAATDSAATAATESPAAPSAEATATTAQ